MRLLVLPAVLSLLTFTSALPTSSAPKPLPLLVWHGLGDRYDADGLHSTGDLVQKVHPGTHVYYIRLDDDGSADRTATFFGNLTTQVDDVCSTIQKDPKLLDPATSTIRVDALGFSQGGQFLRGLIQRCEGLNVRSLVTFGSQHNGIAKFQECANLDFICKGAVALVKNNAWTDYVQSRVVPAQYYREIDPETGLGSEAYINGSNFLSDINNEKKQKNAAYKAKIASLEKFVMYVFEDDTTVIPKESGWFAQVNATSGKVTDLRNRTTYAEDWLGLRELDDKGGLVFKTAPGGHMQLDSKILKETFAEYFGPEKRGDASVTAHAEDAFDEIAENVVDWVSRTKDQYPLPWLEHS